MVGVPGRSKGCNTCRKRRVKCDEAKPLCQRCVKAGFECLGYGRETLWRHTSTAPFPAREHPLYEMDSPTQPLARTIQFPVRLSHRKTESPPQELSFIAFQGDICFAYLFENFVWRAYGNRWLEQAAEGKLGGLSMDATTALAHSHFGRSNIQGEIQLKGHVGYGKCLKTLAQELGRGVEVARDGSELIVPILVLMMHASSHAHRTGAVYHLKGIAKLLYLCGPEAFQRQPLLNAFDAARATLLVASLISRQRLFLDDPKWRSVPWALDPAAKSPQSHLLDIFVTLPALLEDHALLSCSPSSSPIDPFILSSSILSRIETQLETLFRWRWRWQLTSGHEVTLEKSSQPTPRLLFARFGAAADITLYNAVLMWLLALLWKVEPFTASEVVERCAERAMDAANASPTSDCEKRSIRYASFAPLCRPGSSISVRAPAKEICRVFEWQSRHHAENREQTVLYLFPIGMALSVLDEEEEEVEWVTELLGQSAVTRGYAGAGGGNVAEFGHYVTREALNPDTVRVREDQEFWQEGEAVGTMV